MPLAQVTPMQASRHAPDTHFSEAAQVMPEHCSTQAPAIHRMLDVQVMVLQVATHWPLLQESPAAQVIPAQESPPSDATMERRLAKPPETRRSDHSAHRSVS